MTVPPETDVAAVRDYCRARVPPQHHNAVRVECDQRGKNLTIYECRPPWNPDLGTEWTRQPVAQLRYDPTGARWTLYYADRHGRWHPYPETQPSNHIATLLAELTVDPTGIFWG